MLIFYNEEDVKKLIKTLNNPASFHRHLKLLCLLKLLNLYKNVDFFSWSCLAKPNGPINSALSFEPTGWSFLSAKPIREQILQGFPFMNSSGQSGNNYSHWANPKMFCVVKHWWTQILKIYQWYPTLDIFGRCKIYGIKENIYDLRPLL